MSHERRMAGLEATIVAVPARYPVESAIRSTSEIVNVLLLVLTEDGAHGSAYVAGFTRGQARAVCAMLEEFAPIVVGRDPSELAAIWRELRRACRLMDRGGPGVAAISAIDMALWDLKAKALGEPLHALLGTVRHTLPVYASDGCWLSTDKDQVASEAQEFVRDGFNAVKVRVGRNSPADDLATVQAVRELVGADIEILVDANQGWSRATARRCGRALIDMGVDWLEEPVPVEDVDGLALIQQDLRMRVVSGESMHYPQDLLRLIQAGAVSMVMPDLQRVGGVTGWLQAASIAEAAGVDVTSHLFPEVSAHLLAASAGTGPLEHVSWMDPFLEQPISVVDGVASPPSTPGIGLEFDWSALKEYIVE